MKKKSISAFYAIIVLAICFISTNLRAQTAVQAYGQLSVSGNKIVNQSGNPIQLQGMSLFWSQWQPNYYNYNTIKWLRDDWCINIIRSAMGVEDNGGYLTNGYTEEQKMRAVIEAAVDLNIYVLVDWHSHYAYNNQAAAVDFFDKMSKDYGHLPNVIYEIYNEPLGRDWNGLKSYHEAVINAIRANDPDNIIVCGTPDYSSHPEHVVANPINKSNIAYTLHYYASSHFQDYRDRANSAMNAGLCVFVTEYGNSEANGDGYINQGSANDWWNWMEQNKISHCNWSLCNKNEASAAIKSTVSATSGWSTSDLTTSGNLTRNWLKSKCPDYPTVVPTYINIPSKIEAESYTYMSGVQKEACTDVGTGFNVGYIDNADWLEYWVNADGTADYNVDFRIAANAAGGSFNVLVDGVQKLTVTVPATGGWQTWNTITKVLPLTFGKHKIKLVATGGGWNLNYINFSATSVTDCFGTLNGNARVDNCDVCSGGNTGVAVNACEGGCLPGYSSKGILDDFTLTTAPFNENGGVYTWNEATLGGDAHPNFQAVVARNTTKKALEVNVTQGQGEWQPFGFSFGINPTKTINISADASFELIVKNTSAVTLRVVMAAQDVNFKLIDTYAAASGTAFSQAYLYNIGTDVAPGATVKLSGTFAGGFYANYGTNQYNSTFDYTKVSNILITVTSKANTGAPNYLPLALSGATLEISKIKVGDCSLASNNNLKDCHGDINGTASIDACNICSGGNTGITPKTIGECVTLNLEEDVERNKAIALSQQVKVSPNPFQDKLELNAPKNSEVQLLDMNGKVVREAVGSASFSTTDLLSGIYIIRVISESEVSVMKVVKP